ncbi:inositol monophosphatase family protein [Streptomyces sp. AV19]|uniref:inositol monophosphatase family protein n=1 Tax=Streptomyces sp. AV19 TaxID=2793068 RepID=UPI001F1BDD40|nr:inositol monophosphatase family protein [Streptomyces sp. AV19]MDG4536896.1 inositol monophosphatase [Streptomyces sp. AV19]
MIHDVAAAETMPRFRQLVGGEIAEKRGPHDLVTVADRIAEERLAAGLIALLPGSAVVGEESVYADAGVLGALSGDEPVWIVDPIDGTRLFVQGDLGFTTLVCLAHRGESLASWTYAPGLGLMAVARRGGGAVLNGEPLRCGSPDPGKHLEVSITHPDFTTEQQKRTLAALSTGDITSHPCVSSGWDYLEVARGSLDAVAFTWENAWDHAAGLLLVAEAGGVSATVADEPFRIAGGNTLPFGAARDEATLRRVLAPLAAAC